MPRLFSFVHDSWLAIAIASCALAAAGVRAEAPGHERAKADAAVTVAEDGAWCWFSDPRAVTVQNTTYAGWVTTDGSIVVGTWDHASGRIENHVLHAQFERDDHDNPALLVLPDGRVAAFYSLHARGDMRLRVTTRPRDISAWTPERELGFHAPARGPRGTTYANPVLLRDENSALYVFWRGDDFKPTFAVSRDLGLTWTAPRTLIARPGADDTNRPYVKVWSDGQGRIDFVFTDGHPRGEPTNSVYYVRYARHAFWRADGTRIAGEDDLPIDPAQCDLVYDGRSAGRAWVWDVAADDEGRPCVAYTRMPGEADHRYAFASWTGDHWASTELGSAGRWFPRTPPGTAEREPHYSGGMCLSPSEPFAVYLSRPIENVFEIERWQSADRGANWTHTPITTRSSRDNVRPFIARGDVSSGTTLFWLRNERYLHYTDFRCAVMAQTVPAAP